MYRSDKRSFEHNMVKKSPPDMKVVKFLVSVEVIELVMKINLVLKAAETVCTSLVND